jgi:hypothetical protein
MRRPRSELLPARQDGEQFRARHGRTGVRIEVEEDVGELCTNRMHKVAEAKIWNS